MTPAEYVIKIFGGVRAAAKAIGRDPSTVCSWKRPKSRKGCDGDVPGNLHRRILLIASQRDLDLTSEDLIFGRED
jgi:hypothetical protein